MNKTIQDKKAFLTRFKTKKAQDYTYAILFLLVSSFFALLVIRPVLAIAIGLHKEGEDLQRINTVYEQNIGKVLELQADLELLRPKKYLLDDALPNSPKLNALINDIRNVAQSQAVDLDVVGIEGLQIKSSPQNQQIATGNQVYGVKINISLFGSYEEVHKFLLALAQQRRIKTIEAIEIVREKDPKASGSATPAFIKLKMSIQAYYL